VGAGKHRREREGKKEREIQIGAAVAAWTEGDCKGKKSERNEK
jgi:hypothetical protein